MTITPQQARDAASAMRGKSKKARKEAALILKQWQAEQGKTRGSLTMRDIRYVINLCNEQPPMQPLSIGDYLAINRGNRELNLKSPPNL